MSHPNPRPNERETILMSNGPLLILSGPSGSGKSTLVERVLKEDTHLLRVSVSATTRKPREGEVNGVHYYFWTVRRFQQGIEADEFLEYTQVFGKDYYGTLRREVEDWTPRGVGVILVIDVQGAAKVRAQHPEAVSMFVRTSSMDEYEKRIRGRKKDDEAAIQKRLETTQRELDCIGDYQYVIVNDNLDNAVAQFRAVIAKHFPVRSVP
jgi:guanylate kinase